MSGIDKIIEQIETDAHAECASVLSAAQSKADAVVSAAGQEARQILSLGKEQTAAHVADIKKRGDSAADLEEKRVMLGTKQQIIREMLAQGLRAAKSLPDEAYFSLILKMIEKYSLDDDGVIFFGEKDLGRLPSGFTAQIAQTARGRLTLSDQAAPIEAGFILQYGGVEQNCSFDAIFASEAETLSDTAGRLLF